MKKKIYKGAACLSMAGMMLCQPSASYGAWQAIESQWQFKAENSGEPVRSAWYQEKDSWYFFDDAGFMVSGWHLDGDGRWYFLNPVSDGTKGKMMTGWQWVDGRCYYLSEQSSEQHPLGAMYVNERTPDGYQVDSSGAWINEEGLPVYYEGKGIMTKAVKESFGKGKIQFSGSRSHSSIGGGSSGGGGSSSGNHSSISGSSNNSNSTGNGEGEKISGGSLNSMGSDSDSGGGGAGSEGIHEDSEADETGKEDPGIKGDSTGSQKGGGEEEKGQEKVNWKIRFTDSSNHQIQLAPERKGSISEVDHLTIYFQTQITDADGHIWQSKQQSPYTISITGPQNRIIYVEYIQTGEAEKEEEPWQKERELLSRWLKLARKEEGDFTGMPSEEIPDSRIIAADKNSCDIRLLSAASRMNEGQSQTIYIIGKNYMPEGSVLAEIYKDSVEYSCRAEQEIKMEEDTYTLARFQLSKRNREIQDEGQTAGNQQRHWKIGDVQERSLGGITYRFRCIDENYGDETDKEKQKALFLCDQVIPADTGSEYIYEKMEDGTYGYRFSPGPIVSFGETDSYKHSAIRRWLGESQEEFGDTAEISTGVTYGYSGSTEPGSGEQLRSENLKSYYIGSQKMTDHLFILSLDEALKYRRWLWKFEGSEEENPESQLGMFCKSYWLRTPGKKEQGESENHQVYVVDLAEKNIHPQTVEVPDHEDPELVVTGSTGVRPVFAAEQY